MPTTTFTKVWCRPQISGRKGWLRMLAPDRGTLVVKEDSLEFHGRKEQIHISDIKKISYSLGMLGYDWFNYWIKIEYGDGRQAFFMDRSWGGWGAVFGGNKRIWQAVLQLTGPEPVTSGSPSPKHTVVVLTLSAFLVLMLVVALYMFDNRATRKELAEYHILIESREKLEEAGIEYEFDNLMELIRRGDISNVELFIKATQRPRSFNSEIWPGLVPLALASKEGHTEIVGALIEAGADVNPNIRRAPRYTPLMYAIPEGNMEIVSALLEAGAEVNATAAAGRTALMLAALWGHRDVVRALVEAGAEVDAEDNYGHTALTRAAWRSDPEITAILKEAGAEIPAEDINGDLALISAAVDGNPEVVSELIKAGADVNAADENGLTALIAAVSRNHREIAAVLIEAGADVNAADDRGRTALMTASSRNHREAAATLIEAGADLNARNARGETALMLSLRYQGEQLADLLIDAGADVNIETKNGRTALHIAVVRNRPEQVSMLINQNAEVNSRIRRRSGEEHTPLYLAARGGHSDIFSTLIAAGGEIGEQGGEALWWAVFRNRPEMAETLINAGVDLDSRLPVNFGRPGRAALERSAESTNVSPLMVAVYYGRANLVSILIDAGADVNLEDSHGRTVLSLALSTPHRDPEIVQALRDAGAESHLEMLREGSDGVGPR